MNVESTTEHGKREVKVVQAVPEDAKGVAEVFYRAGLAVYPNEELGISIEDIQEYYQDIFTDEKLEEIAERITNPPEGEALLVAKENDKVIGLCRVIKHPDRNELHAIYILPESQGQGIGGLLWQEGQKLLDQTKDTFLHVTAYNAQAIAFYEKLGFQDTGKRWQDEDFRMRSGATIPKMEMVLKAQFTSIEAAKQVLMTAEQYAGHPHDTPYVFAVEQGKKRVVFFGSEHSKDPDNPMFSRLREVFERLQPTLVLCEGMSGLSEKRLPLQDALRRAGEDDAIRTFGEAGLGMKLATESGTEFDSPEPPLDEEIRYLLQKGFLREEIFAFYMFRFVPEYQRSDTGSLEEYVTEGHKLSPSHLEQFKQAAQWDDFDYSADNLERIAHTIWGENIDLEDPEFAESCTNPIPWEGKEENWKVVNEIAQQSSLFRDMWIIDQLARYLESHDSILIIYGASHAVMQEPAIQKLLEQYT